MKDTISPLFSQYILDGVQMDETPFSALYDCLDGNGTVDVPEGPFEDIVDEYLDRKPISCEYDPEKIDAYVQAILRSSRNSRRVNTDYPVTWTRNAISAALLDCIFREGHFTLQDILLIARWDWNNEPAGNLAAFYDSTVTAGRYLFDLGVKLDRYFVESNHRDCLLELELRNRISLRRKCPDTISGNAADWLVYIPFDNSPRSLGGSALSTVIGNGTGAETDSQDPDYFIDCYEVVRELVEDGVITAGIPVGYGGLITAAEKFRGRNGFTLDAGNLMAATGENDIVKLLFSETPGIIAQIRDEDYDYIDSQFLLQEIAYYPLGHPDRDSRCVKVTSGNRSGVAGILDSLLKNS
ncbi:MAG: hypothetical protein MJY49_03225 [Bacteroidales bacterium]|nr:hypothetical protein [Bacteroidales bacterium]